LQALGGKRPYLPNPTGRTRSPDRFSASRIERTRAETPVPPQTTARTIAAFDSATNHRGKPRTGGEGRLAATEHHAVVVDVVAGWRPVERVADLGITEIQRLLSGQKGGDFFPQKADSATTCPELTDPVRSVDKSQGCFPIRPGW
jgi:hypothetical protein